MTTAEQTMPLLYTAAQCRELDRQAIETHGIDGFALMQRAGHAAFRELLAEWPQVRRIAVCCGKGNNAGDGYLVAGLAREMGLGVVVYQLGDARSLRGDAARARDWAGERGVVAVTGPPPALDSDVVVDALLGTGIEGDLRPPYAQTAALINASGLPVLAIDVPTGVSADTGAATPDAVRATLTVTFIGRKLGLYTGAGIGHAGRLVFDGLGVPPSRDAEVSGCPWLHYQRLPRSYRLPARDPNAYKHALGHVVVVGGDHNMGGAPLMAAEAALRTGAGMVSVITRAAHRPAILARRPEIMVMDAEDDAGRSTLLDKATVLVAGPGLGQAPWGENLLDEALERALPTVLDADGLTVYARRGLSAAGALVVTPHAGEAARLLDCTSREVASDRPGSARALAARVGGVAVLKGAGSLVAALDDAGAPRLLGVCAHGNPGMATAGMGDVQSGVIAGLLAQGMAPGAAAVAGTCLHGLAGDRAAGAVGQRSLVAMDLVDALIAILAAEEQRS